MRRILAVPVFFIDSRLCKIPNRMVPWIGRKVVEDVELALRSWEVDGFEVHWITFDQKGTCQFLHSLHRILPSSEASLV